MMNINCTTLDKIWLQGLYTDIGLVRGCQLNAFDVTFINKIQTGIFGTTKYIWRGKLQFPITFTLIKDSAGCQIITIWKDISKKNWLALQFYETFSLESRSKVSTAAFFRKEKKIGQISFEFALRYKNNKHLIKIFTLHVNGNKKHSWYVFNNKIVTTALLASPTAFLFV